MCVWCFKQCWTVCVCFHDILAQQDSGPTGWRWPSLQAGRPASLIPLLLIGLSSSKSLTAASCFPPASSPPTSLHPSHCLPFIHASSGCTMLSVLDSEHWEVLHKSTIHHCRRGQLKPHDTQTSVLLGVCDKKTHSVWGTEKVNYDPSAHAECASVCNTKSVCLQRDET